MLKVRKGKVGGFKDYLDGWMSQMDYVNEAMRDMHPAFGYSL